MSKIKQEKKLSQNKVNREITSHEVRLIDENGEQHGIVSLKEALNKAESVGLDLVEIAAQAHPPVVRILNYDKFQYEISKKEKELKKKQRLSQIETKEIWFRPVTTQNDIDIKLKKVKKFLESGDRVKLGIKYRGREMSDPNAGTEMMQRILNSLDANVINPISIQNRQITVTISKP